MEFEITTKEINESAALFKSYEEAIAVNNIQEVEKIDNEIWPLSQERERLLVIGNHKGANDVKNKMIFCDAGKSTWVLICQSVENLREMRLSNLTSRTLRS
ncbi:MAG: hypothetical protein EHM85_17275 [Desulfobacteraceae bacterium]|nr:MAG: hypothetical protein EHM85_17275 [Desulfobacteraceae bacterium]